jgi:hypothetical protein
VRAHFRGVSNWLFLIGFSVGGAVAKKFCTAHKSVAPASRESIFRLHRSSSRQILNWLTLAWWCGLETIVVDSVFLPPP